MCAQAMPTLVSVPHALSVLIIWHDGSSWTLALERLSTAGLNSSSCCLANGMQLVCNGYANGMQMVCKWYANGMQMVCTHCMVWHMVSAVLSMLHCTMLQVSACLGSVNSLASWSPSSYHQFVLCRSSDPFAPGYISISFLFAPLQYKDYLG